MSVLDTISPAARPPLKVTLFDVAQRVGVSHTAVSLALRGAEGVSPKVAKTIRRVAAEMNYAPKIAAQMMRSQRTGYIGLIVEGGGPEAVSRSGFTAPLLTHFVAACERQAARYHIEFFSRRDEFQPPSQLAGGMVDGALLAGYVDAGLRRWLAEQQKYPWVNLDEPADYCVLSQNDVGVAEAIRHLAAFGHRRVAFLGGVRTFTGPRLARQGFEQAARELALDTADGRWVLDSAAPLPQAERVAEYRAWCEAIFAGPARPTAVFCDGMSIARTVIHAALERGWHVPRDLSVISYGGSDLAEATFPFITAVEANYQAMVDEAIRLLRGRIDGSLAEPTTLHVMPRLVVRETVAQAGA